jgi:hypothetical protein
MTSARAIEIDDDIVGMHMVRQPQYNGMVGTVVSIVHTAVIVNGEVLAPNVRYFVLWADGARSMQHEWQVRLPDAAEEAFAHACAMEILSRFK